VEEAILVTQNYHLDRAVFIGRHLGIDAVGYAADRGGYSNLRKNKIREAFATVKSVIDVMYGRKPKFLGKKVDLDGKGNFSK
jgi:SanA protein